MARRNGTVNSQMPRSATRSLEGNPGRYRSIEPPFDRPQDTGNGGIPSKMMEDMGAKPIAAMTADTPGKQGAFASGSNNRDYIHERPVSRMPPPRGKR